MIRRPPRSTLFPSPPLFRSPLRIPSGGARGYHEPAMKRVLLLTASYGSGHNAAVRRRTRFMAGSEREDKPLQSPPHPPSATPLFFSKKKTRLGTTETSGNVA